MDNVLGDIFAIITLKSHITLSITSLRLQAILKKAKNNTSPTSYLLNKFPNKKWNWRLLSNYITMDTILAYPNYPWNWYAISHNPNLTVDMILRFPDKPWAWCSDNIYYRAPNFDT